MRNAKGEKTGFLFLTPDGVTSIGDNAFDRCESLTHIHIPSSVTSISSSVFNNCTSLQYICSDVFGDTAHTYAQSNNIGFRCCTPGASVTVTFDSVGGSAVSFQNIPTNDTATVPASPTKDGYCFLGWITDGEVYDFSTPVTQDITLSAEWIEDTTRLIGSKETFSRSSLPSGWTSTVSSTWQGTTQKYITSSLTVKPHTGSYFAYHTSTSSSYLIRSAADLSDETDVTLNFWYQNIYRNANHDQLVVYYRVSGDAWNELFRTDAEHTSWTEANIVLPPEAMENEVEIGFYKDAHSGYGVFLDDIRLFAGKPEHDLTYSASGNVLTAVCANSTCTLEDNTITLTLNAPAKTLFSDSQSAEATLSNLSLFNLHTEQSLSANSIESPLPNMAPNLFTITAGKASQMVNGPFGD